MTIIIIVPSLLHEKVPAKLYESMPSSNPFASAKDFLANYTRDIILFLFQGFLSYKCLFFLNSHKKFYFYTHLHK